MKQEITSLFYDWGKEGEQAPRVVAVDDETLRDGLQSPSAVHPPLEGKLEILHHLAELEVEAVDVGMPAAGPKAAEEVLQLCRAAVEARWPMQLNCAARALEKDLIPLVEISQAVGICLEVMLFSSVSHGRLLVEGWSLTHVRRQVEHATGFARGHGLMVTFVVEDASRTAPETLQALVETAVQAGATRLCLADTTGALSPGGAENLCRFVRRLLPAEVGLDWHGHNDRGLAMACALAAARGGADRLHGSGLGVGERTGNAPLEQVLVNLHLLGLRNKPLLALSAYAQAVSRWLHLPIPPNAPVVGRDAFRTATGVHAAAILKAKEVGRNDLAELVYAPFPPAWVGRRVEVEVGPMSGAANVRWWLMERGLPSDPALVQRLLQAAKQWDRELTEEELQALLAGREET